MLNDDDRWLLSFYRVSEIGGSLFFGHLARSLRPGPIQRDLSRHFAEEALHAWYWTECLDALGSSPLKLDAAYQDRYLAAAGPPANLMEALALTQVFERRVVGQYALHARAPGLQPEVRRTLDRILVDERWHVAWVREALRGLETEHGREAIEAALRRFTRADAEVYGQTLAEHGDRIDRVLRGAGREA